MPPPQQHLLSPGVSIIIKAVLHSSFFSQAFLVLLVFLTFVIPLSSPSTSSSTSNTHVQQQPQQSKNKQEQSVLSSQSEPIVTLLHQHHHHFSSHEYSSADSLLNPCPEASRWPEFCAPLLNTSILSETSKKALKDKVHIAKSMFCDTVRILNKIDCAQPFTVSPRWRLGCQEAYRDWSCSILVEEFIPEGLHSCDSTCHNVIRNCPYLSPDRVQVDGRGPHPSQYGGHPAFFCPTNSLVNLHQSEHTEDFFFVSGLGWDQSAHFTCIIFNPSEAQLNWDSFPLMSIDLSNINFTFCHEYGSGTGDINAPVIVAGDSVIRGGQDPSASSSTSSDSTQQNLSIFPDIHKVNVSHCCWTYSSALPQLYTSLASTLRRKELEKVNCVDLFSEDESSHLYEENIEPEQTWALAAQNQIVLQCFVGQESRTKSKASESITHLEFENGANNIDFPSGGDNTKLYHYYDADDDQPFHHFYSHDDNNVAPLASSVRVRRVDNNANNEGDHFSSASSGDVNANLNEIHGASSGRGRNEDDYERQRQRKINRHNNQYVFNGRHHSGDHYTSEDEVRAAEKNPAAILLLEDQEYMLLDDDEDYNNRDANTERMDEPTTESGYSSSFSTDDFIAMVTHASTDLSSSSRKRTPKIVGRGKREAVASSSAGSRLQAPLSLSTWLGKVKNYCIYVTSTLLLRHASNPATSATTTATSMSTTSCCFLLHNYWLFLLLLILIIITILGITLVHSSTTYTNNNMTTTLLPFLVLQLQHSLGVQFEEGKHDDSGSSTREINCSSCSEVGGCATDNNEARKKPLRRRPPRTDQRDYLRDFQDAKFIPAKIVVNVVTVTVSSSSAMESRPRCPRPRQRIRLRLRHGVRRTLVEPKSDCMCSNNDFVKLTPILLSRKSSVTPLPCCSSDSSVFNNNSKCNQESERNSEFSQSQFLFILLRLLRVRRHSSKITTITIMQLTRNGVTSLLLLLLHNRRRLADSSQSVPQTVVRILLIPKLRLRLLRLQIFLKLLLMLWARFDKVCKATQNRLRHFNEFVDNKDDCGPTSHCLWRLRYFKLKRWRRIRKGSRFKGDSRINLLLFLLLLLKVLRLQLQQGTKRMSHSSTRNRTREANHNYVSTNIFNATSRLRHSKHRHRGSVVRMHSYYCSTCCYCCRTRFGYVNAGLRISRSSHTTTQTTVMCYFSIKWWLRRDSHPLPSRVPPKPCNNLKGCVRYRVIVVKHERVLMTSTT